jgi:hypothetical protein
MLTKAASMARALACATLLAGSTAHAQTGELWEMTSQMSMPGMPAGMIPAQTTQVCQSEKFDRPPQQEEKSKCTISNLRQLPNRVTYDIKCEGNPPSTGSADYSFEANRTRVKGTMKIVSREGEMVMQMSGRKVGACDAAEHKKAQMKPFEDAKKKSEAAMKQADDQAIKACRADLDKMQPGFGIVGHCTRSTEKDCQAMMTSISPAVKNACTADINEFCKRYQTRDGLQKIGTGNSVGQTGRLCGVPVASVRARLCPAAVKDEAFVFVAQQCPAEAKLIAQKECGGRAFSVQKGTKYFEF